MLNIQDYPDTEAYAAHQKQKRHHRHQTWQQKPRHLQSTTGMGTPQSCVANYAVGPNFAGLFASATPSKSKVKGTGPGEGNQNGKRATAVQFPRFCVLRGSTYIEGVLRVPTSLHIAVKHIWMPKTEKNTGNGKPGLSLSVPSLTQQPTLICVMVRLCGRGTINPGAMLCTPTPTSVACGGADGTALPTDSPVQLGYVTSCSWSFAKVRVWFVADMDGVCRIRH